MTRPAYVVLALWPNGRPRALVHVLALVPYELAVSVSVRVASARQHWDVCGLVACLQPEILFQEESCKHYGKHAFPPRHLTTPKVTLLFLQDYASWPNVNLYFKQHYY